MTHEQDPTPDELRAMRERCDAGRIEQNNHKESRMIGYMLKRSGGSGWMFAGVTAEEVANTLRCEMDCEEGVSLEDRDVITLEPFETTQAEIDAMPEFEGW